MSQTSATEAVLAALVAGPGDTARSPSVLADAGSARARGRRTRRSCRPRKQESGSAGASSVVSCSPTCY